MLWEPFPVLWVIGLNITYKYVEYKHGVFSEQIEENKEKDNPLMNSALFGDSAGAINAIFFALAFAGVIFAIILQRKELQYQRKELTLTNEQLEGQKNEFITQNQTLRLQRFENTFFQMMSLQQEIVNNLSYLDQYEKEYKGRKVFEVVFNSAKLNIEETSQKELSNIYAKTE